MARIAGVNIPTDKRVHIALTYIHGIGNTKAKEITTALGIDEMSRVNQLSDDQVVAIREKIDADHLVEGELRTQVRMNIKRLPLMMVGLVEPVLPHHITNMPRATMDMDMQQGVHALKLMARMVKHMVNALQYMYYNMVWSYRIWKHREKKQAKKGAIAR